MVTLDAGNQYVHIINADMKTMSKLDAVCSYYVSGAHFASSFKKGWWDGRVHLLALHSPSGQYRVPIGMLEDIQRKLDELKIEYCIRWGRRHNLQMPVEYKWEPSKTLRPYQQKAVENVVGHKLKSGILKLPIRSGKTRVAGRIIYELKAKTLFLVPDKMLLYQTQAALAEVLDMDADEVGIIGDGRWIVNDITVASIMTLVSRRGGKHVCKGNVKEPSKDKQPPKNTVFKSKPCRCGKKECKGGEDYKVPRAPEYNPLTKAFDLVIFDECHHLRGDEWRKAMMDIEAAYRLGLSATVYLDLKSECERGVIWLKACCGNIRASISTSKLIELGYLVQPKILLYKVTTPDAHGIGWHSNLLRDTVFENKQRNQKIVDVACGLVKSGMRVLIITRRLKQAALIGRAIKNNGISMAIMIGDTKRGARDERIEGFKDGSINVLIGTVIKEGVDIPEVEAVINAEGGRDIKATVQRMRNLTPHKDKDEAIFIDFIDMTSPYTAQHSLERLKAYRMERAFDIRIMDDWCGCEK
jgi:superfamily II DNA or RNA helicase